MRYFFTAILILGAFVALSPSSRQGAVSSLEGAWNSRRTRAANERIGEIVALAARRSRDLPPAAGFKAFVDKGLPNYRNAGTDPWGTPYYLKRDRFNYRVGSAGPDKLMGTDDDIVSTARPFADNRYRGGRR